MNACVQLEHSDCKFKRYSCGKAVREGGVACCKRVVVYLQRGPQVHRTKREDLRFGPLSFMIDVARVCVLASAVETALRLSRFGVDNTD